MREISTSVLISQGRCGYLEFQTVKSNSSSNGGAWVSNSVLIADMDVTNFHLHGTVDYVILAQVLVYN